MALFCLYILYQTGRSREGAWIEMLAMQDDLVNLQVAPVRERGLKFLNASTAKNFEGRSREGAWIEIIGSHMIALMRSSRSREGAWIEMHSRRREEYCTDSRSREGAWIEILIS